MRSKNFSYYLYLFLSFFTIAICFFSLYNFRNVKYINVLFVILTPLLIWRISQDLINQEYNTNDLSTVAYCIFLFYYIYYKQDLAF